MEILLELMHRVYDVENLIKWGGIALICAIVFAETGLMVGFFLPGDSLLITAGVFAAAGHLDLIAMLVTVTACAIIGDQVGYYIGKRTGPALFTREESLLFKRSHVMKAQEFYERYGAKTIVIARFVPIVRTFAPVVAGVGVMNYRRFVTYNILGGMFWTLSMILSGYFLGNAIPNVGSQIHLVIVIVVALSVLPAVVEIIKSRRRQENI